MAVFEKPVTPAEIGPSLRSLIEKLVPGGTPVHVDVAPMEGGSVDDCFVHVPQRVQTDGGSQVLGWALWELPGVFMEAEAHSVWMRPNGELLDITPKKGQTARVFFLPDPAMVYRGLQIDNVRRPVSRAPCVQAYLDACDEKFKLLNRGGRAGQYGEIRLTGDESDEYQQLEMRSAAAFFEMLSMLPSIDAYSPCPCGSGKKLKWCHKSWA